MPVSLSLIPRSTLINVTKYKLEKEILNRTFKQQKRELFHFFKRNRRDTPEVPEYDRIVG